MTLAADPQAQDADRPHDSDRAAAHHPLSSARAANDAAFSSDPQSRRQTDRRQAERRQLDRRQTVADHIDVERRLMERRHGDRRQLDRRFNDRLNANPAGPIASVAYAAMERLGMRRPRQFLVRCVYPWLIVSAYSAATVLCLVLALHDAVIGGQRNDVLRAQYNEQLQQWHARIAAAQSLTSGEVASVGQSIDGSTEVNVVLNGLGAVKIVAESRCVATQSVSVGSTVSVLQVTGVPAIPPVLSDDPSCLVPSAVAAAPGSPYAPPHYPLLSTVRAHLVMTGVGIFGMTLFTLGLWRRLQRLRYGIGAAMNLKRRARRRDYVTVVGLACMVTALFVYPMLDTFKPALHRFGLA